METDIKLVDEKPPIYEEAYKAFGPAITTAVFTYDNAIYNCEGKHIAWHIIAHEKVHMAQQKLLGGSRAWWNMYLEDSNFRFLQELEAYRMQYRAFCEKKKDRNMRAKFLHKMAGDLTGPMYGHLVSYKNAALLIKE